jgi:predicted nucleic acid-binding Zn ribbon protein
MRKSQTRKISDVIQECLRDLRIDRKLKEVNLVSQWETMMGKTVSSRTKQIYIKNRILYLQVSSSVLKNELLMMRRDIVAKLNENAGENLIDDLKIW